MNLVERGVLRLIGIAVITLLFAGCNGGGDGSQQRVELKGESFLLELATTPASRRQGLMHREQIAANEGMLFVFSDLEMRSFWMKNCLMPIDAIFLDGQGHVVAIREMQPPAPGTPDSELESYSSGYPARFVIEIAGGRADNLGLEVGDRIDLPTERLKRLAK